MDIESALIAFRDDRAADLAELRTMAAPLLDIALDSALGGKHLRARFCHAGWCVAGGAPEDPRIVTAAAAFEWLQASALVHDDIMDESDTRRGKPTVHRRIGTNAAILVGDLQLSWADQMIRSAGVDAPDWHLGDALRWWDLCKTEVVTGQFLDVTAEERDELSVEQAMAIVEFKSAKYTIERPLHVGAALAGAGPDLLAALSAYAIPLGQAFQLRDDILGVYGDSAVTGKPTGDDLREGKRTALVAHGTARLGADRVFSLLGREESVDELATLLTSSGARAAVEEDITRLEDESLAALDGFDPAAREVLERLVDAVIRREH